MQGPPIPPGQWQQQGTPPQQMGPPEQWPQQGTPPQQMAPPGTLGQVAGNMDPSAPPGGGGDLSERYNQALAFVQQKYAPLMRPQLPEPQMTPARVLANIVTFGGVGVADAYRSAYNRRIQDRNDALTLAAHRDAMDLVEKQAEIEGLGSRQNMALLGLQMRLRGLEQQAKDSQLQQLRWLYDRQLNLLKPPTEGEIFGGEAYGGTFVPGMGWNYNPAAPNSPLGREGLAGPAAPSAGASPADRLRQRKEEAARRQADLEVETAQRKAADAEARKPLDAEGQTIVAGLTRARELIQEALTEFTPEERRKFVGVLRNPANRWAQVLQGDPRFQQWQALIGQLQQLKFSFGGRNLTKQENDIIERFLPTGREWGGGDEFDVKAAEFSRGALAVMQSRLRGAQSRTDLEQELTDKPDNPPPKSAMDVEEWLAR